MKPEIIEILIAEDNDSDAELTIRELKKNNLGNNLLHLKDGEEILDFIYCSGKFSGERNDFNHPKLILLDIQMPKVNGIEVLQKIKQDPGTRSIPVVILTSSKENKDIQKCYELGANSYIVKPVSFAKFTEAIRSLSVYWMSVNQPPL